MKNFFLSLIFSLFAIGSYATSSGIDIINQSPCDVYVQIRGSKVCPSCELDYVSNLIFIPGGGMASFPNTMMLGGTFPTTVPVFVNSAVFYSGPRQCPQLQTWFIGDPQCGYAPQISFFTMDQNCRIMCDRVFARWLPAPCSGIARLIITP